MTFAPLAHNWIQCVFRAQLEVIVENLNSRQKSLEKETHLAQDRQGIQQKKLEEVKLSLKSLEPVNSLYFDAYRLTDFSVEGNLTYNGVRGSSPNIFEPFSGIFKAPSKGAYLLMFHANTMKGKDGLILLKHNGATSGGIYDTDNYNHNTLSQAVILELQKDDLVWIEVLSGGVRSNQNVYVHFIGVRLHG